MKNLSDYIFEKIKISSNDLDIKYNYFPQNRDELAECIKEHLNNGNSDLTDIDVSNVKTFNSIFRRMSRPGYREFNEIDVTGWNTSNVTDMSRMFFNCFKLEKIKGIEDWDVSNVESMRSMFYNCHKLQLDISSWNIKPECDVEKIVYEAEHINLPKLY